jgi:flavin-dependent dehydrogenase
MFCFKTEENLFSITMGFPMEELPEFRRDIEAGVMRTIDLVDGLGERVRAGRRVERICGASDLPNFYRKPFGPGWALVGDAGVHKDPFLAIGICDAWRDAEFLSDAIAEGLAGTRPMQESLADYEKRRNEAMAADFDENLAMARFTPFDPQVLAIRAAVRHNPEQATRLIKARMGMIDPAEFYNPENLERLLGVVPVLK